jgi:hypothetical protein
VVNIRQHIHLRRRTRGTRRERTLTGKVEEKRRGRRRREGGEGKEEKGRRGKGAGHTVVTGEAHTSVDETVSELRRHRWTSEETELELLERLDSLIRLFEHLVDVGDAEKSVDFDFRLLEDAQDVAVGSSELSTVGRGKGRGRKGERTER